ncbi:TCR/Tet family MFS transporter [Sphingorhabdus sp. Alg239-R122]|uniref:TCR/Tet family MFS transporter n=1 Tax=Sphingorhabdus sp. Alg239-R122 TaxID=2305989 RepID=UPI0013DCA54C|nr:TCR/Tet family MFS transporter [Sphingorhabdus sp. Alg239-R122]
MTNTAPRKTTTLWFVAMIVFIDMAGFGLIVPVLPSLITGMGDYSIAQAATIGGWLLFTFAVMQFFFAPVIGGLSDRFGRRPVLLFAMGALCIDYALMALAPTLVWLFLGRAIAGIMGGTWAAANSCVADISNLATRGRNFGIMGAAGGSGFVIGPGIGGFLGEYGDRMPFIAACILCFLTTLLGYFWLRETLPPQKRRSFSILRANPLGSLIVMSKFPLVIGMIAVIFLLQLAAQTEISVWAYYGSLKFDWGPREIGLSVTLWGLLFAIVQGGLVSPVQKWLGEVRTVFVSLLFGIPTYLIFAYAPNQWWMVAGIVVGAATALAFPVMQSMMSARISDDAQGELQGAIASAVSLTSIIGPVMMAMTFEHFADDTGLYFPGAPFLLSCGLLVMAIGAFLFAVKRYYGPPPHTYQDDLV